MSDVSYIKVPRSKITIPGYWFELYTIENHIKG